MKNIKTILFLFIFSFCILSCSKDDEIIQAKTNPAPAQYRIKEQLFASGTQSSFSYNSQNKITKIAYSDGFLFTYNYNNAGQIISSETAGYANMALNNIKTITYDLSGFVIEELVVNSAGDKYKYVYTNNSSGFPLTRKSFKWNTTNSVFEELLPSGHVYFYNTINQLLRLEVADSYILYSYDSKGNLIENKTFKKAINGSYYLQAQSNTTFDDKRAFSTTPNSNRINNPLELIEKRFSESGDITSQSTFNYSYEYNEMGYPIKKYSNGILKETNTFEIVN